ncbi:MAG: outer membrane protein assembly factor BamD [Candidatus Paceibacterota bacterium]
MPNYISKYSKLHILFSILWCFTSCSGRSLDARGREELKYSKIADTESTEKELYVEAIKAYDNRQFNSCSQTLEILLQNYPEGVFQEPARLKLIDAKFHSANYSEVVTLVDSFLELFPSSPVTPYLLTIAGTSYAQTFGGLGRDPTPLIEARQYFERIIKEYPESDYSLSAKKSLQKINQTLVSYEGYLVDYYKKQKLPKAAKVREQKKKELHSQQIAIPVSDSKVPEGLPLSAVK